MPVYTAAVTVAGSHDTGLFTRSGIDDSGLPVASETFDVPPPPARSAFPAYKSAVKISAPVLHQSNYNVRADVYDGVGASIVGIDGSTVWGVVVSDERTAWRLDSGRIAKKLSEGLKWTWNSAAAAGAETATASATTTATATAASSAATRRMLLSVLAWQSIMSASGVPGGLQAPASIAAVPGVRFSTIVVHGTDTSWMEAYV